MSERSPEAFHAALAILGQPLLLLRARRSSLPRGMTLLLEVAAGDPDAIREAQAATGDTRLTLSTRQAFLRSRFFCTGTATATAFPLSIHPNHKYCHQKQERQRRNYGWNK